jgi:hypothetical protein
MAFIVFQSALTLHNLAQGYPLLAILGLHILAEVEHFVRLYPAHL